jgi:membrane protein implicated in regulation of membrane protease activity
MKQIIAIGWLCFVLGILLMVLSITGFIFFYIPLFLAAFILSIIGMTQKRIAGGIFLLLVTLIIPPIIMVGYTGYKFSESLDKVKRDKKTALSAIVFEDIKGYIDGNYMYLEGKVRNNGDSTVEYVKVGVEWLDKNGTVLDTDWTFAVAGEGL